MQAPYSGDGDDFLRRFNELGREIVNDNGALLQGIRSAANENEKSRRWLILQTLAIVGFVVPLLLSQATVSPALGVAKWACGVLLVAVIVLFIWDTVWMFVIGRVIRAATAAGSALLAARFRRETAYALDRMGLPREPEEALRALQQAWTDAQARFERIGKHTL